MKWGSPIECASARACATAEAEQQLRSASFSESDQSSSVTAADSPSRAHRSAATALSTPPLMATSVRARRLSARRGDASSVADGGTERPRESVGGQLGRVQLARAETPELGRDLPGAESRRLEHGAAPGQRDRRAAGGGAGATPARVEAGVGDPIAVNADRELDLVAARETADRGREGAGRPAAVALGRGQVVLEGDGIHRPRG